MTWFELMQKSLHAKAGLGGPELKHYPMRYNDLAATEWSPTFERLMRNRLIMGAMRYGKIGARNKPSYDRIAGARKRLAQYATTGNLECLVDVANMVLLEFEESKHPNRHWAELSEDHCYNH
jgi:hypothetical protein